MPKIIENLENRLIEEARRQIEESGYGAMTIRSVAKGCGVGVGTVYNYYTSKDELLAAYLLGDWKECVLAINSVGLCSDRPEPVCRCIYDQLNRYVNQHRTLFQDTAAAASFAASFSRYHRLLRSQLAKPLEKFCGSAFASEFIAEALLTWTLAKMPFPEIYAMIEKLF